MRVLKGTVSFNSAYLSATENLTEYICYNGTKSPIYEIFNHTKSHNPSNYLKSAKWILSKEEYAHIKQLKGTLSVLDAVVYITPCDISRNAVNYKYIDSKNCAKVIESAWAEHLLETLKKVNLLISKNQTLWSVAIKGAANVGKSMLAKSLSNYLMTKVDWVSTIEKHKQTDVESGSIVILDVDIGQPIYGVPTSIKAYEVVHPILTNHEMALSLETNEKWVVRLIKSYYIGEIAPDAQEEYYLSMVKKLYDFVVKTYQHKKAIIILNSFSWNDSVCDLI